MISPSQGGMIANLWSLEGVLISNLAFDLTVECIGLSSCSEKNLAVIHFKLRSLG